MKPLPVDSAEEWYSASDLSSRAEGLLQQVRESRRPVVLAEGGKGAAVLVDFESYQALLDENELLKDIPRALADIEAGRVVPHDEALARLLARYA